MNKPWKVSVAFATVFVAGGVTGGLVAVRVAPTFVQRRVMSEQFATSTMRFLTESLTLSPDQVEKIRPVVTATGDDLVRLRRDTSAITVYKSTGHAMEDMAAASVVLQRAEALGLGLRVPI